MTSLTKLPTVQDDNIKNMLAMFDDLRERVQQGEFSAVFFVGLGTGGSKDSVFQSGHMQYAEIIGRLEMIKLQQWAEAAGVA